MQFDFSEGWSTVDALSAVVNYIQNKLNNKLIVIAVSLDVKNAFNSLSWGSIRWSLERDGYPMYLRRIIDRYLSDRFIEYPVRTGEIRSRNVTCGVPQGSVLGPLLWNIAYDFVLRIRGVRNVRGCTVVGYADDTLVLGFGPIVEIVQSNLNIFMVHLLRRISSLSLSVAAEKTEIVLFRGRRRLDYIDPTVRIGHVRVPVQAHIKYLGVILDDRLNFRRHFSYIDEKVGKITRALCRLMPNLRGPHELKRKLYTGVITAVVMYAAPIWAPSLAASADSRRLFRRWQRTLAVRVCAAYRSVSFDSATLLARLVPHELLAMERARIFWRFQDMKEAGEATLEVFREIRNDERVVTRRQWVLMLSRPGAAGIRLRDALLPHVEAWMTRSWGGLTFPVTQLLTGHGCFGSYLQRIRRAEIATCPFCGVEDDTPEHTLESCTQWFDDRCNLMGVIGPDLSLSNVIRAIASSRESWIAFSRFAENVMRKKENAERERALTMIRDRVLVSLSLLLC